MRRKNTQGAREVKWYRSLRNHLWLDNQTSGHKYRNIFRGCAKRLAELKSTSSESMRVGALTNQITNLDYDRSVETLKGEENLSLAKR